MSEHSDSVRFSRHLVPRETAARTVGSVVSLYMCKHKERQKQHNLLRKLLSVRFNGHAVPRTESNKFTADELSILETHGFLADSGSSRSQGFVRHALVIVRAMIQEQHDGSLSMRRPPCSEDLLEVIYRQHCKLHRR